MAQDFGTALSVLPDIGGRFTFLSARANLGERLACRLTTPRGGLFYDEGYGLDVRGYLNEAFTDQKLRQIESEVAAEVEKDPRVLSADVAATAKTLESLTLAIQAETADGPFDLVLAVTAVTVALLRAE